MPDELSQEAIAVLLYLMPGFLAAWIFYGLTSHPKPSQFERVVQALIFTFVVHTLVTLARLLFEWIGGFYSVGYWSPPSETAFSGLLAISMGAALAYGANTDKVHEWLRSKGFTTRTSHPSEWYCVLSKSPKFVILHLTDERRLYGWPKEWPIERDRGQFYMQLPTWINEDGAQIDLPQLDGILVDVKDVRWVEVLT